MARFWNTLKNEAMEISEPILLNSINRLLIQRKEMINPLSQNVTGKLRGVKDYFEVALKTDTTRRTIAKWKFTRYTCWNEEC